MEKIKVKDLKIGMDDVTLLVEIDYVPEHYQGEKWGIVYVKDETKDIRMILTGDCMKNAKEGLKLKITHGYVSMHKKELQLNTKIDFPPEIVK